MNRGSEERKSPPDAEAVFNSALKCVMVSAMISDGEIREEERKTVAQIFNHITGSELNDADLDSIVTNILNNPQSVQTLLSRLSNSLTEDGKELLLKAAIMTVGSDGSLSEPEREFIATISSSLSLSSEQIEAILTSMRKPQEAAEAV
jgi:uncharacterized membrane protein YebE (DUF533 family)